MKSFSKEIVPYISAFCTEEGAQELLKAGYVDLYVLSNTNEFYRHMTFSHDRELTYRLTENFTNQPLPTGVTSSYKEDFSKFFPGGPIPESIFDQVLSFFQQVCSKFSSQLEAHCYILWNDVKGYYVFVPKQQVAGASVTFSHEDIPAEDAIIVDIHSHGAMGAFFSGTDDTDDANKVYVSGVIGKVTTRPEYVFRFNVFKKKFDMKFEDIFSTPGKNAVKVPAEWLGKVTTYTAPSYTGVYAQGNSPVKGTTQWGKTSGPGWNNYPGPKGTPTERSDFWNSMWGVEEITPKEASIIKRSTVDNVEKNLAASDSEDYVYSEFGTEIGDAYSEVIEGLSLLEGEDAVLTEVWRYAFEMMSSKAQSKIMTEGL